MAGIRGSVPIAILTPDQQCDGEVGVDLQRASAAVLSCRDQRTEPCAVVVGVQFGSALRNWRYLAAILVSKWCLLVCSALLVRRTPRLMAAERRRKGDLVAVDMD